MVTTLSRRVVRENLYELANKANQSFSGNACPPNDVLDAMVVNICVAAADYFQEGTPYGGYDPTAEEQLQYAYKFAKAAVRWGPTLRAHVVTDKTTVGRRLGQMLDLGDRLYDQLTKQEEIKMETFEERLDKLKSNIEGLRERQGAVLYGPTRKRDREIWNKAVDGTHYELTDLISAVASGEIKNLVPADAKALEPARDLINDMALGAQTDEVYRKTVAAKRPAMIRNHYGYVDRQVKETIKLINEV
ncbi:MAG: hypothetical protein ACE5FT_01620, partial [Candidatus Nanoarchaeia archaeon]